MMDIQSLMPVINALGWMLIHFLWQGCAIAAAYWLVCWLTPNRSPVMHYWTGMLAYLSSAVAPLATFLLYLKPTVVAEQAYALTLPTLKVSSAYPVSTGSLLAGSLESIMPAIVAYGLPVSH